MHLTSESRPEPREGLGLTYFSKVVYVCSCTCMGVHPISTSVLKLTSNELKWSESCTCASVFSAWHTFARLSSRQEAGRPVSPPAPNSAPGCPSALITVASPPAALSPAPSTFPHHHPEGVRSLRA